MWCYVCRIALVKIFTYFLKPRFGDQIGFRKSGVKHELLTNLFLQIPQKIKGTWPAPCQSLNQWHIYNIYIPCSCSLEVVSIPCNGCLERMFIPCNGSLEEMSIPFIRGDVHTVHYRGCPYRSLEGMSIPFIRGDVHTVH